MRRYEIKGRNALVTGASSGIGRELSRCLAAEGANLVLAALPSEADVLEAWARSLETAHGVKTWSVAADLSKESGPGELHARTTALVPHIDILVNCAGLYAYGDFHELSLARQDSLVRVNATAVMALTHLFLPDMIAQREGRILNVSSTAAFQPTANEAVYAATKAFVQSFSEAVRQEVRKFGVVVCTLNPQTCRTPMMADVPDLPLFKLIPLAEPREIAQAGVRAISRGKAFHVTDARNYFMHGFLPRISSRETVARVGYYLMRPFGKWRD